MFQTVITRVENQLAGWKAKCLSLAGRITLIKSTISAIPAYAMQSAHLPRSVCDDLDKRIRRFLWGGTAMERKPHLVAWDTIIKEKTQGGLGIRSMRQLNSAFLTKLGWRLKTEPSMLWVRVLQEKYSRGRDLESIAGRASSCSNAWRGIMETIEPTSKGMGVAIGDGRQTEFWNHRWLDGEKLSEHALHPIPEHPVLTGYVIFGSRTWVRSGQGFLSSLHLKYYKGLRPLHWPMRRWATSPCG